jgi:hypothetical protein
MRDRAEPRGTSSQVVRLGGETPWCWRRGAARYSDVDTARDVVGEVTLPVVCEAALESTDTFAPVTDSLRQNFSVIPTPAEHMIVQRADDRQLRLIVLAVADRPGARLPRSGCCSTGVAGSKRRQVKANDDGVELLPRLVDHEVPGRVAQLNLAREILRCWIGDGGAVALTRWRTDSLDCSAKIYPHHRSAGVGSADLAEPCCLEHGQGAGEQRRRRHLALETTDVDRVSVEDRGAVLAGVLGSGPQQRHAYAYPAVLGADCEASHPPC